MTVYRIYSLAQSSTFSSPSSLCLSATHSFYYSLNVSSLTHRHYWQIDSDIPSTWNVPHLPFPNALAYDWVSIKTLFFFLSKFWISGLGSATGRFTNMVCFLEGVIKHTNVNTTQDETCALQSAMVFIFHNDFLLLSTQDTLGALGSRL